ncbi:MAG TPA: substrate-binding domain-containing protein [Bryobacteraceae bacterium]|nr:substrate-binding domain-containing protein [Bryobacteraceae bacterium]
MVEQSTTITSGVTAVSRACAILRAFRYQGETLRLRDLVERTRLSKVTVHRIAGTLAANGLLERAGHGYRSLIQSISPMRFRVGYAAQSDEFSFSRAVTESLRATAAAEHIDLIIVNNRYSRRTALRNAEFLIREKVDLIVEFQTDQNVAPIISSKYLEAGIPTIAVEIPHPGATYFGANNYAAGVLGGRFLGRWTKLNWAGLADELILLELPVAGPLPRSRLTGVTDALRELLPALQDRHIVRLDGNGQFGPSLEQVRKHLRRSRAERTLVAAINDPSALGALRAFEEAGRVKRCAVLGQNASEEARAEMRSPETRLIGSVGYFPERYGKEILALAAAILHKEAVPPAIFVKHEMITPANVDRYYPNDALLSRDSIDAALFRSA